MGLSRPWVRLALLVPVLVSAVPLVLLLRGPSRSDLGVPMYPGAWLACVVSWGVVAVGTGWLIRPLPATWRAVGLGLGGLGLLLVGGMLPWVAAF